MLRRRLAAVLVAAAGLGATAVPAQALPVDVPAALGHQLHHLDARTPLAVLLPDLVDLDVAEGPVTAFASGGRRSWEVTLAGTPDCGGANACTLATFQAAKGEKPAFRTRVKLRGGATGFYKPLTCGGSCADPALQVVRRGVLYELSFAVAGDAATQRRALVRAANDALRAGPRR